jgi:hypothetical protein
LPMSSMRCVFGMVPSSLVFAHRPTSGVEATAVFDVPCPFPPDTGPERPQPGIPCARPSHWPVCGKSCCVSAAGHGAASSAAPKHGRPAYLHARGIPGRTPTVVPPDCSAQGRDVPPGPTRWCVGGITVFFLLSSFFSSLVWPAAAAPLSADTHPPALAQHLEQTSSRNRPQDLGR